MKILQKIDQEIIHFFEGNTWFGTQETQDNRTDGAVMTQEF